MGDVDDEQELGSDAVHQCTEGDHEGGAGDRAEGRAGDRDEGGAGDGAEGGAGGDRAESPEGSLRFDRWRRRSAAGAMMTGIAFGLQEALERKRKEVPIVQQADGDPSGPKGPIELRFDPDHPEKTVAVIRPWLMDEQGPNADDRDDTSPPETAD